MRNRESWITGEENSGLGQRAQGTNPGQALDLYFYFIII